MMTARSLAATTLMLAACAGPPPKSPVSRRLIPGVGADFMVLDVTLGQEFKHGAAIVTDNQADFEDAWTNFEFITNLPRVNFEQYQVWFFVQPLLCPDGGVLELAALEQRGNQLVAVLALPGVHKCIAVKYVQEPGVVYAVAVRRDAGAAARGSASTSSAYPFPEPNQHCAESVEQYGPSPEPFAHVDRLARGQVQLTYLLDGRAFWVVHHADGTRSALPAEHPLDWLSVRGDQPSTVRGLRVGVNWNCWSRRFEAGRHQYDEYGTPTRGMSVGVLPRYALTRRSGGWRLDGPVAPPPVVVPHPALSWSLRFPDPTQVAVRPYLLATEAPLEGLVRRSPGERVLVDADLWLFPNREAGVCRDSKCVPATGVWSDSDPQARHWIEGPVLVEVQQGRVSNPIALGYYREMIDRREQPKTDDFTRNQGARIEASLAGHFGASETSLYAGPGARLSGTVKTRLRRGSLVRQLVGNRWGLALAARLLWIDETGVAASHWAGVTPVLRSEQDVLWDLPSLLGLAVPELGVVAFEGSVEPYLSWSAPFTYGRPRAPRQRPYTVHDVTAYEFGPTFTLKPADADSPWFAGAFAGVTVW